MDTLFHRFKDSVKGVLEGFDRIVFKGAIRPIAYKGGKMAIPLMELSKIIWQIDYIVIGNRITDDGSFK